MNRLDQFYTTDHVAKQCLSTLFKHINIDEYDYHLEPSAGTGAFYKYLSSTKRIGLDIEPKHEGVQTMDFLTYSPLQAYRYLVVGNPPFGRISSLAIKFFNKRVYFK